MTSTARRIHTLLQHLNASTATNLTAPSLASANVAPTTPSAGHKYIHVQLLGSNRVALVTLTRPEALNALCDGLMRELYAALALLDQDAAVGAIVLTGSEKAFAAGADIKEMAPMTFPKSYATNMLAHWDNIATIRKPIVAAVNGYALGGNVAGFLLTASSLLVLTTYYGGLNVRLQAAVSWP